MSALQSEIYEAFRSIDIPEDKALKAATALGKRDEDMAADLAKRDSTISTGFARHDAKIASIKSDLAVLKWMSGFTLVLIVTILARIFIH